MIPTRLVAFDTSALSVVVGYDLGDPARVSNAEAFIREAIAEKTRILIPAPVLFEVLNKEVNRERREQAELSLRRNGFQVVSFDHGAALVANELWADRFKAAKLESGATKRTLIADLMIVACSIASGAETLFTYDDRMALWAKGRNLQVAPFPPVAKSMFGEPTK